jgi:hypothetical protein
MWCGLTAEDPRTCGWDGPPGYGNSWRQNLTSVEFTVQGDVTLGVLMEIGVEEGYDFVFVQYEDTSGSWVTLDEYDCGFISPCDPFPPNYVVPAADHDGTIRFRFFLSSDGAISNANRSSTVHSALVVDNITVSDDTGVVDFQDFESESINDAVTTDGHWFAEINIDDEIVAGALSNGNSVLQESVIQNNTNFWTFFEGSTSDYACAGHPEQATTEEIRNIVRSPRIDLTRDIDGFTIEGEVDSIQVAFDVYRDIPDLQQGKSYMWAVYYYSDCLIGRSRSFHRGDQKDWYRHAEVLTPPVGTTSIVIELGVNSSNLDSSECYSHSPLFDNVTVERFGGFVTAAPPSGQPAPNALGQNRPNPFNATTSIEYEVPAGGQRVELRIFDVGGRMIRTLVDEWQSGGAASVIWDGTDGNGQPLASGVYFYELRMGSLQETRRMVLVK